ncbi:MAG: penicillin-binding protein activator LpoB [Sedimenticola sp.]
MKRASTLLTAVTLGLLLTGCQTTSQSVYQDPKQESIVKTTRFQAYDVGKVTDKMIDSMLMSDYPFKPGTRQVVRWAGVKNKTNQHLDTKMITNRIRTQLVRSGRVRLVSDDGENDIRKSIANERKLSRSSAASATTRRQTGLMSASAFKLYGDIQEIASRDSNAKSSAYLVTINLIDVETGELIWADEKEIIKAKTRSTFGS